MGRYIERDYSYNSRSRSREARRNFVFLDGKKQKGTGRILEIVVFVIFCLALLSGAAWLMLMLKK